MQSPLQATSQTYETSVNTVDQVMVEHNLAMACWSVQEVIAVGLGLFDIYDRLDSQWRQGIRNGHPHYHLEQGLELKETNEQIIATNKKLIHLIGMLERQGYTIDGADAFRSRLLVPFDDRPLDVPFTEAEFNCLTTVGPKAPDDEQS